MKTKIKNILTRLVIIYAMFFPNTDLIINQKTLEEMEDDGEIHLGI